jgi:hypothetical protein
MLDGYWFYKLHSQREIDATWFSSFRLAALLRVPLSNCSHFWTKIKQTKIYIAFKTGKAELKTYLENDAVIVDQDYQFL